MLPAVLLALQAFGITAAIQTDNGAPFKSLFAAALTPADVTGSRIPHFLPLPPPGFDALPLEDQIEDTEQALVDIVSALTYLTRYRTCLHGAPDLLARART